MDDDIDAPKSGSASIQLGTKVNRDFPVEAVTPSLFIDHRPAKARLRHSCTTHQSTLRIEYRCCWNMHSINLSPHVPGQNGRPKLWML